MGTHPIFESDFDCLTDFEMVLECVRIKHVPNSVSERDLEDDWGDLNISQNGIYFLQDRLYVFFNDKRDAEDAQNRGLSFNKKILKAKHHPFKNLRLKWPIKMKIATKVTIPMKME